MSELLKPNALSPAVSPAADGAATQESPENPAVLVVDLDGTLVHGDLLFEGLSVLAARNPLYLLLAVLWLFRGRAALKKEVAERAPLDPSLLPYNQPLLAYLNQERQQGRKIALATAADHSYAVSVAQHLGLFSAVIASDGKNNRRGRAKSEAIRSTLGDHGFVYVGNDVSDLEVFERAERVVLVSPPARLRRKFARSGKLVRIFPRSRSRAAGLVRALRPHQWSKNLLVFLPAVAGHQIGNPEKLLALGIAFAALSLMASALYILNDLLDLAADRGHPTKRHRPLAAGNLSIPLAGASSLLLIAVSLALSALLPRGTTLLLLCYAAVSLVYSLQLKKILLLDVFVLVGLYLLRLLIGHQTAAIGYSFWFMMFFGFIFTGLAVLKRFNETQLQQQPRSTHLPGRAYRVEDAPMLAMLGVSCGIAAVLILGLYINSEEVRVVYGKPYYLVVWCPLFLFALFRLWILAQRGELDYDPVIQLVKDPLTYILGAVGAVATYLAA